MVAVGVGEVVAVAAAVAVGGTDVAVGGTTGVLVGAAGAAAPWVDVGTGVGVLVGVGVGKVSLTESGASARPPDVRPVARTV